MTTTTAQKKYPADFVKRAKAEYPSWPELHKALDSGNQLAGKYLDDASQGEISPNEVVKMIYAGQVQQLRAKADRLARRRKLYRDWGNIAESMFYGR